MIKIGIISDIQYCDQDNKLDYTGNYERKYRQSLRTLREACSIFAQQQTDFNIALGDIIDMSSLKLNKKPTECLEEVIAATNKLDFHFVLGNHDHTCFNREEILAKYKFGSDPNISKSLTIDKMYYSFCPISSIRCIFLHSYDITVIGEETDSDRFKQALQIMLDNNPTMSTTSLTSTNIHYDTCHYAKYNGGFSMKQIEWLERELQQATAAQQRCILFSHVSIHKECTKPDSVIFNYQEVLTLIQKYHTVISHIAGHEHQGGYYCDEVGVHHIVPPAPLECDEQQVAYGILTLQADHMTLDWYGRPPMYDRWPDRLVFR